MIVSGLFEYNVGHTEFLVLFLGLISLPFAGDAPSLGGTSDPVVPVLVAGGPRRSASAAERPSP
jgi:hypothetical protein